MSIKEEIGFERSLFLLKKVVKMNGKLITFEGIDGCGKTTLARAVCAALGIHRNDEKLTGIVFTKEPGDTALGQSLRTILQKQKEMVCDLAEFLLFAADRAQHFQTVIIPQLKQGSWIIADRLADSSVAYQGYGRGLDIAHIRATNAWAMQGVEPDLTIYVQIDIETARERFLQRNEVLSSFEREKHDFWQRVITGYEAIFAQRNNVLVIDGKLTTEQQVACIMAYFRQQQWL